MPWISRFSTTAANRCRRCARLWKIPTPLAPRYWAFLATAWVVRVVNHIADNPLGQRESAGKLGQSRHPHQRLRRSCEAMSLPSVRAASRCTKAAAASGRGQLAPVTAATRAGRRCRTCTCTSQSGPIPGSPTLPFRLLHYVTHDAGNAPRFHLLGVPEQGTRLTPLSADAEIAECFAGMSSTRVRYRIEKPSQAPSWETIETTSGAWGQICYRSLQQNAALHASTTDNIHLVQAMEGRIDGILGYLWLGLSLVPFSRDRRICWTDEFDPRPFRSHLTGWAADLIEPFTGVSFLGLRRQFARSGSEKAVVVTTELSAAQGRLPQRGSKRTSLLGQVSSKCTSPLPAASRACCRNGATR